jgi:hypothetical protein
MESGGTEAGPGRRSRGLTYATTVTTLPALAAIVLGLLYAIGALVRTAELRGAGMTVRDTITLVPIEQHLARGIAVALSPETLLAVAGIVVLGLVFYWALRREQRDVSRRTSTRILVLVIALLVAVAVLGVVYRPFAALAAALAGAAMLGVLAATGVSLPRRGQKALEGLTPLISIAAVLIAAGVLGVVTALVDPQPLPDARLTLDTGKEMRGGFLAVRDGVWYLDTGEDRLRAIPTWAIVVSEIRSRQRQSDKRRMEQSLPTLLESD